MFVPQILSFMCFCTFQWLNKEFNIAKEQDRPAAQISDKCNLVFFGK